MINPSTDRRSLRTRQALENQLVQLLQTRSLQKISISELTELADVSRGTFYLHFNDIFDLYQSVERKVVKDIAQIVAQPAPVRSEAGLERVLGATFEYLADHIEACEALLRTDSASFLAAVFERTRPIDREAWEVLLGPDEQTRAYSYVFISYGVAGMLKHWLDNGKQESPRQIAQIAKKLLTSYMRYDDQKASDSGTENHSGSQLTGMERAGITSDVKEKK